MSVELIEVEFADDIIEAEITEDVIEVEVVGNVVIDLSGGADRQEHLIGLIDGTNTLFTTSLHYVAGTTEVLYNGQRIYRGVDYNEQNENEIVFTEPPLSTEFIDHLWIKYRIGS